MKGEGQTWAGREKGKGGRVSRKENTKRDEDGKEWAENKGQEGDMGRRMRLQCAIIRVSDFAREGIQSTVKCT